MTYSNKSQDRIEHALWRIARKEGSSLDEALLESVYERVKAAHTPNLPASADTEATAPSARQLPPSQKSRSDVLPANLSPLAPELDPSEARKSLLEAAWLYAALKKKEAPSPRQTGKATRAGYRIYADVKSNKARVFPAFAAALHAWATDPDGTDRKIRDECRDLWSVDLEVWLALTGGDFDATLIGWLESPGRRLVQDLQPLARLLAGGSPPGDWTATGPEDAAESGGLLETKEFAASVVTLDRLLRAAGWDKLPPVDESGEIDPGALWKTWQGRPPRWLEMHTAIPGLLMDSLLRQVPPVDDSSSSDVERWIEQLSEGLPAMLKGAALARLLDRCADSPAYVLEAMARNLREDFAVHLAVAQRLKEAHAQDTLQDLDTATLELTAALRDDDHSPEASIRAWGLSRWLQRCLARSPWFGEDLESLVVRLRALAPEDESTENETMEKEISSDNALENETGGHTLENGTDALAPGRFRMDGEGLPIDDIATLSGLLTHYFDPDRADERKLLPLPLPLLETLRQIARREETAGERRAEQALRRGRNLLHWRAPHLSPPWTARWFLTHFELTWLAKMPEEIQRDCLDRLANEPETYEWLALALRLERSKVPPEIRTGLLEPWRAWLNARDGSNKAPVGPEGEKDVPGPRCMAMVAIGLLDLLEDDEAKKAVQLAPAAGNDWWLELYARFVESAEELRRWAVWETGVAALLHVVEDPGLDDELRVSAAQRALRLVPMSRNPRRAEMLKRFVLPLMGPPFRDRTFIVRELRRLGFATATPDRS